MAARTVAYGDPCPRFVEYGARSVDQEDTKTCLEPVICLDCDGCVDHCADAPGCRRIDPDQLVDVG